jgi:hypothetical protein
MVAAVGFVVYSGYYIRTHSRKQIIIAWLALGVVFALALIAISYWSSVHPVTLARP